MHVLTDYAERRLIHQQTHADDLRTHLDTPRSIYAGFDPTAPSLTVGNLVQIINLARFQRFRRRFPGASGAAVSKKPRREFSLTRACARGRLSS